MKDYNISNQDFFNRLERFKNFDFRGLSDDEIFWRLTYVMFFNMGKKASMIEKKLFMLKNHIITISCKNKEIVAACLMNSEDNIV